MMRNYSFRPFYILGLTLGLLALTSAAQNTNAPTHPVAAPQASGTQSTGEQTHGSTPNTDAQEMKIAAGDLLDIEVFDAPELKQQVRVSSAGTAELALIGSTHLAGQTQDEAAHTIARELHDRKFLVSPQVNVLIKEFGSQGVSITGEVQHPGVYQVLGPRTVLDVISMAGGLTNVADTRVTVKRRSGGQGDVTIKLKNDDPGESLAHNVQVYPGDLVLVPRAGIVYVLGEVTRPGGFVMQDSGTITLLQALAQAGGATKTASENHAVLLRKNNNGYSTTKLELNKIAHGGVADITLHANDVVYIPSNKFKTAMHDVENVTTSLGSASIYAVVH